MADIDRVTPSADDPAAPHDVAEGTFGIPVGTDSGAAEPAETTCIAETDLTTSDTDDTDVDDTEAEGTAKSGRGFWRELPGLVVIALVTAIVLKTFVIQAFFIPSASMEPTLQIGDRVLVSKLAYLYREPQRGEVVVFREETGATEDKGAVAGVLSVLGSGLGLTQPSERDFIKRIIGLPGDEIAMQSGVVTINGEPLPEAAASDGGYLSRPDLSDFGPVTVEDDHYFMMGDNRPNSADSRFQLGQIPSNQLIGRAFVTIWPLGSAGSLPIASYDN